MEDPQHIHLFKTNIRSSADLLRVKHSLNNHMQVERWNIDRQDIDCVLRIVSKSLTHTSIIKLINQHGYECVELV